MDTAEEFLLRLQGYGQMAVALSGGVDSATLAKAAVLALGDRAVAVTAVSALTSAEERRAAHEIAAAMGIRQVELAVRELMDPLVAVNDEERCYHCKRDRFEALSLWAQREGFAPVAEGSNVDDQGDYRPGMRAVAALFPRVVSPFLDAGWGKAAIRQQAKVWGLSVWNKPSAACLASRVAYGIPLTARRLAMVEEAERAVRPFAEGQLRVRHHGAIARIEAEATALPCLLEHRVEIVAALQKIGFSYVTLDLMGYRMGSANEVLRGGRTYGSNVSGDRHTDFFDGGG
ncbi:MAG: ATP-dependent sacrificial sulfur transferase LarE [Schwartzia sp. (in: firmicutes)]